MSVFHHICAIVNIVGMSVFHHICAIVNIVNDARWYTATSIGINPTLSFVTDELTNVAINGINTTTV